MWAPVSHFLSLFLSFFASLSSWELVVVCLTDWKSLNVRWEGDCKETDGLCGDRKLIGFGFAVKCAHHLPTVFPVLNAYLLWPFDCLWPTVGGFLEPDTGAQTCCTQGHRIPGLTVNCQTADHNRWSLQHSPLQQANYASDKFWWYLIHTHTHTHAHYAHTIKTNRLSRSSGEQETRESWRDRESKKESASQDKSGKRLKLGAAVVDILLNLILTSLQALNVIFWFLS